MTSPASDFPPLEDDPLSGVEFEPVAISESDPESAPKRGRKKRSDAGVPRGPRGASGPRKRNGMNAADRKLADDLLGPWAKIVKALSFVAPTVAGVMTARGEATAQGIVSLASPKMKDALQNVAKTGPGLDLAETVLMMVIAAAVDFGRVDPDSPVALLTGVSTVYDTVHPDKDVSPTTPDVPETNGASPFLPQMFAPFPGAVA